MTIDARGLCIGLLFAAGCGSSGDPSTPRGTEDGGTGVEENNAGGSLGAEPDGVNGGGGAGSVNGPAGMNGGTGAMGPAGMTGDTGGSGGVGDGGAGGQPLAPTSGDPLPLVLDGAPQHYRYVRLTHEQWENSVQDNLRLAGSTGFLEGLFQDAPISRYSNNENRLQVGPVLVADYAEAAEALAQQIAADPTLLAAVYSGGDALGFVTEVGRRFYRRPLTADESATLEELFTTGSSLPSASDEFTGGASLLLQVLMQAPHFLYRIEAGETGQRLNGFELATKLAYVITNSTPSDALLDQAASGALDTDEGVRTVAQNLLDTARATATMRRFHSETFRFGAFNTISKDPSLGYADGTNANLLEASYLFFDRIFQGSLGVRDVFLSDVGFVSDDMAALYGSEGPAGDGFLETALGPERPGFFTQLPFLILQSNNLTPNSIRRGTVINHDVLCAEVPAELEGAELLSPVGTTNREVVTNLTAGAGCADCHHDYLNPLGFAFENFDGLGRLREEDNGVPVDTTGAYPFVEGQRTFDGAPELMRLLAESQQAHTCYASHLAEFGLAHELGPDETPVVDTLTARSLADGASIEELLLELVTSPTFQTRQGTP